MTPFLQIALHTEAFLSGRLSEKWVCIIFIITTIIVIILFSPPFFLLTRHTEYLRIDRGFKVDPSMHKLWHNDKSWHSSCHRNQKQQQLLAVPLGESGHLQNIIFLLISYLRNITFDKKVQAQEQLGWREKERAVKILKFPALRPRRWWGLGLFLDPTRALYAMACQKVQKWFLGVAVVKY